VLECLEKTLIIGKELENSSGTVIGDSNLLDSQGQGQILGDYIAQG